MSKINVTSAQNVSLQYELAGIGNRIGAFLIDLFHLVLIYWLCLLMSVSFRGNEGEVVWVIFTLYVFFYSLVSEIFFSGQSIGKRIVKLRVVRASGEKLTPYDCVIRWSFRWLDIYTAVGIIGIVNILSTKKHQRIGGILSDTIVVKVNGTKRMKLDHLLSLKTNKGAQLEFPRVKEFNDEEMLMVKNAIAQIKKNKNQAHKEILNEMVEVVCERMGIEKKPKDSIGFLNRVIKEYVTVTR